MFRNPDTNRMDGSTCAAVTKQDLHVGLMVTISRTLASLVQDLLGPGGQQTLLSTPTGKVKVTRDGLTILSSLHLAHPVAHLIMRSLHSYSSQYGDGSKTFILYLSQVLKDIADRMDGEVAQNAMSRVKLSLELSTFLCSDYVHIAKLVLEKVKACSGKRCEERVSVVKNVLKSSLRTCLQTQVVPFFTDYLAAFLSLQNPGTGSLESRLEHILQHFDMYCSKIATQPQQKSRVCRGILLEANLQNVCRGQSEADTILDARFALMDVSFDESENGKQKNGISIHLTSDKVQNLFQKRASVECILKSLRSAGVHVLLCCNLVPDFVKGLCRENSIIVQCIPQEKLMFLRDLTGAPVLIDLNEAVPTKCFFVGRICSFVQSGRRISTMIDLIGNKQLKHLIVCSPTEGICDQLCQALFKALKAVAECWKSSFWESSGVTGQGEHERVGKRNMMTLEARSVHCQQTEDSLKPSHHSAGQAFQKPPVTVSCGGTFEAVLITTISDYYASQNHHHAEHIGSLIQKMVLSVPRTLHSNLCSAKYREQRLFTGKWTHMLLMVCGDQLCGFGDHGDLVTHDYIEPVGSKLAVVACVLQLVVQLLRVEAVVPVKKPLSSFSAQELSDDEKDDEEEY